MELLTIPNFNKFTKITLKVASVIIFYSVIKRCPKFVTFIDISLASMKTSLVRSLWEAVPVCSLTHGYRVYLPKWPSMEGINLSAAFYIVSVQFSSVESLSPVRLFTTPWTAACQASLSIINSSSLLKLKSIESVMPSSISSSVVPFFSHLQSFPASGSFQKSQFFTSGGQSIEVPASTSVLLMNIQDWVP